MKNTIRLLRPAQQIKNGAVVLGSLGSGLLSTFKSLGEVTVLVLSWILLSGSIYVLNDITDIEIDKRNENKSKRPVANGDISQDIAVVMAALFLISALIIQLLLGQLVFAVGFIYVIVNVLYSFKLKNLVVLDLLCVSSGFVLRGLSGIAVVGATPSIWFLLLSLFGSLILVSGKRISQRSENLDSQSLNRALVSEYSGNFLRQIQTISIAGLLISYIMMTEEKINLSEQQHLTLQISIFPFLSVILYLAYFLDKESESDVTQLFLTRKPLMIAVFVWLIFFTISMVI